MSIAYAESADFVRFLLREEDRARFGSLIPSTPSNITDSLPFRFTTHAQRVKSGLATIKCASTGILPNDVSLVSRTSPTAGVTCTPENRNGSVASLFLT